jgi:hypothetical protein
MKQEKEDFYITMLRYGKTHIDKGFRLDELVKHLQDGGYTITSENSILLHHYFPKTFYSTMEMPFPDKISYYFLRPEAYFHLLEYDNNQATRHEAGRAQWIAIAAILLTLLTSMGPLIGKWFN